jgi:carboxyl-terminal processing protease
MNPPPPPTRPAAIRLRAATLVALLLAGGCMPALNTAPQLSLEPAAARLSAADRVALADAVMAHVRAHFAHWAGVPGLDVDSLEAAYRAEVLASDDRRAFGLATLAYLAGLGNGHTGFWDGWLTREHGQPLGFHARPLGGEWVVTRSRNPELPVGSVLRQIDGRDYDAFAGAAIRYVPASDRRSAFLRLHQRPFLFPPAFSLTLEGGAEVRVERAAQQPAPAGPPAETTGRWLAEGEVAYLRIPGFSEPHFERRARELVAGFRGAPALIVDLRGNGGGATPWRLTRQLMDRPHRWWRTEHETLAISAALRLAERAVVGLHRPRRYTGRLYLLVDAGCSSACEDFVQPFQDNGRAVLIGERTEGSSGQPVFLTFSNGMGVRVSARRHSFPDGRPFEGIGIAPDVEVVPTAAELRARLDPVLDRALARALADAP